MKKFRPTLATRAEVAGTPPGDGQFIITTDSREMFFDDGSMRIPLSDVVFVPTEMERAMILAPLPKFYFVLENSRLYVWSGAAWALVNNTGIDDYSFPPPGSPPAVIFASNGRFRFVPLGSEGDVLTIKNGRIAWVQPQYQ